MGNMQTARKRDLNLLTFQLKLSGSERVKRIFVSTGREHEKSRLLPSIQALVPFNVKIFATEGTSIFLAKHGVPNERVSKIAEGTGENARSLLRRNSFDLVINIQTGDVAYDEQSDARIIRQLAIECDIPLITDTDVAIATIAKLARAIAEGERQEKDAEAWNMHDYFRRLVRERGGWANYHAHADKSFLITPQYLELGEIDMQKKWELYRDLKKGPNYTREGIRARIARFVEMQIQQGVTYTKTMVDADTSVELRAIEAALDVKKMYEDQIVFEVGIQPLEGVCDPGPRRFFEKACGMADFVGGLPSKDRPHPERHLDFILQIAKEQGKRVDVHVDQENNPHEDETLLLAMKTMQHGMEGRVSAVHSISLACKPAQEQKSIIERMKEAGLSVIVCPSAAISMRQLDYVAPLHNSIAPVMQLREGGIQVVLGVDNVMDFFMPFVDGDMWTEVRLLMEAIRCYDAPIIADMACDKSLFAAA